MKKTFIMLNVALFFSLNAHGQSGSIEFNGPLESHIDSPLGRAALETLAGVKRGAENAVYGTALTILDTSIKARDEAINAFQKAHDYAKQLSAEGQLGYLLGQIATTAYFTWISNLFVANALGGGRLVGTVAASLPFAMGASGVLGTLKALGSGKEKKVILP